MYQLDKEDFIVKELENLTEFNFATDLFLKSTWYPDSVLYQASNLPEMIKSSWVKLYKAELIISYLNYFLLESNFEIGDDFLIYNNGNNDISIEFINESGLVTAEFENIREFIEDNERTYPIFPKKETIPILPKKETIKGVIKMERGIN